jgi:hypothetical protein
MTRRLPLLLWLAYVTPGAFGLGLSYGGGVSLDFSPVNFNGTYTGTTSQVTSVVSVTAMQYFDATWFELSVGYYLNRGSTEPTTVSTSTGFAALLTGFSFGAAVKYPIVFGPVTVFPIIGAEYKLNLTYMDDKGNDLKAGLTGPSSALDELWVKGGIGADLASGRIFFRPILMIGFMPLTLGGAPVLSATHPTGTLTLGRSVFTVDLDLLFGCRI